MCRDVKSGRFTRLKFIMPETKETKEVIVKKLERAYIEDFLNNMDRQESVIQKKEEEDYKIKIEARKQRAEVDLDYLKDSRAILDNVKTGHLGGLEVDPQYDTTLQTALGALEKEGMYPSVEDIRGGISARLEFEEKREGSVPLAKRLASLSEKTLKTIEGGAIHGEEQDKLAERAEETKEKLMSEIADLDKKNINEISPFEKREFLMLAVNIGILDRVSARKTQEGRIDSAIPDRLFQKASGIVEEMIAGGPDTSSILIRDINKLSKSGLISESKLKAAVEEYVKLSSNSELIKGAKDSYAIREGREVKEVEVKDLVDPRKSSEVMGWIQNELANVYHNAYGAVEAGVVTEEELKKMFESARTYKEVV